MIRGVVHDFKFPEKRKKKPKREKSHLQQKFFLIAFVRKALDRQKAH